MKKAFILALALMLAGCSSVTIRTDNEEKTRSTPTFQKSYVYWWWGLQGEHSINVREVCLGRKVTQMQSIATIPNVLVAIVTLGIYQPRSARIWCEEKGEQND